MTKTRTLLEAIGNEPKGPVKKIEFLQWIDTVSKKFDNDVGLLPKACDNIILISRGTVGSGHDVMLAYFEDPMDNCLYLGNWNDGVV